MGWEAFTCLQAQYNLLVRTMEWELTDVCVNEGLGVIPWSPLRGGWLSGKFHRGMTAPPVETRIEVASKMGWGESWENYNNETTWKILDVLLAVANEVNKSPAQVALRWLLQRPEVTAPIIGARTLDQLKNNLGAAGWILDSKHLHQLNKVSDPGKPYPYEMVDSNLR
jgi:aryl-alcohol dehydrogenase-like predicted oxidoreductase